MHDAGVVICTMPPWPLAYVSSFFVTRNKKQDMSSDDVK